MSISYNPKAKFEVKTRDIEYLRSGSGNLLAQVYQPSGSGPFPAIVDIHGGIWNSGDRTGNAYIDNYLAASGIVVLAVDFRLAPSCPFPAQVQDINYATRWLKAHAADFNIDSDCVGSLGASSGGHTALLSAMQPNDRRYKSLPLTGYSDIDASVLFVIGLWPVIDPYERMLYAQKMGIEKLVTGTNICFKGKDLQEGNPQFLLDHKKKVALPPVLIIQGTADANVPLSIPKRFAESYKAAGGDIQLELFPDMPHVFAGKPGPEAERALDIVKEWLAEKIASKSRR